MTSEKKCIIKKGQIVAQQMFGSVKGNILFYMYRKQVVFITCLMPNNILHAINILFDLKQMILMQTILTL